MSEKLYNFYKSYIDKEISIIPCRTTWDEKNQVYTGKTPNTTGWSEYCSEIASDEEVKKWSSAKNSTGFGIVTGEASNIACIDIDTTDKDLIKKIIAELPYTPCVIKGDPKRGGKFLFRLYDTIHEHVPKQVQKQKVKDAHGNTVVDIFYGNAYLCAPPSLHSKTKDGQQINYEWEDEDKTLLKVGVHNLPILSDPDILSKIEMAVKGMTHAEMAANLPKGAIDLTSVGIHARSQDGHRHDDMISLMGALIAKNADPTSAIKELLENDRMRNGDDPYFLDHTKGCKSKSKEMNAINFYLGNLNQKAKGKKLSDIEVPTLGTKVHVPIDGWGDILYNDKERNLPEFNYKWISDKNMRKYVQDASRVNSVSPQNIFFYMMGSLSSVIGNKVKIKPYFNNEDYLETCNLYIGNIASSGERKSQTVSVATKFLKSLNKTVKEAEKKKFKENKQLIKDITVAIKRKEKDRNKEIEAEGIDSEFARDILEEISKLKERLPVNKNVSLYEQQTTPQKMYEIAEDNPTGLFVEFNEWGPQWIKFQSPNGVDEKKFFLDGWDGQRVFSYKTKHHGENIIDELCLSVGFSAQYKIIDSIVDDLMNNGNLNDGMLQRFLLFCSDDKDQIFNDSMFKTPTEIHGIFENAYYMEKVDTPISLNEDGWKLWKKFSDANNFKIKNEANDAIKTALGKYSGLILRLCGNIEVIKCGGRVPQFISSDTFQTAWEMIDYAEAHLRYLFGKHENRTFDKIISMLKTSIIEDETTMRDLYRNHQTIFGRNPTDAMKVVEKLIKRNLMKVIKDGRTMKIKVNPALFS